MATIIDVKAGLAAELKRLVRDPREWPVHDRRRFRNLLLDATSSDAMPMAELLLRAHDDGLLRLFPDRTAARAQWDAATARLASDLQVQRFVESGVARFVAEAWAAALGPDPMPVAKVSVPRAPAPAPRQPPRSSATVVAAQRSAASAQASSASSAASMQANRLSKYLMGAMAVMMVGFVFMAFRQTRQRAEAKQAASMVARGDTGRAAVALPVPATADTAPARRDTAVAAAPRDTGVAAAAAVADSVANASAVRTRPRIDVGAAPVRTTDDIVLNAGRVFEGRVLSIRQQTIVVKDEETGLDFEIAKNDVDRIVTREGRVMRFSDDNVPLIGDDDDLTPMSHGGRYQVRYTERWGTERGACGDVARRWAPGAEVVIRHLRGAPMMQLVFVAGQGFNAAVRSDGLFESGVVMSPTRGPESSFVSTRLSGRLSRGGVLQGVVRLSAVRQDGVIVCDLALTVRGERQP
jgi:preprotein translocase subunit YajC